MSENMTDLEIIMRYTGWERETAQCAVNQWRKQQPDWNAQYVLVYLRPLTGRKVQPSRKEVTDGC